MKTLFEQIDYTAIQEIEDYFVTVEHLWYSCWQKEIYKKYYVKPFWISEKSNEIDDYFGEIYLDEIRRIRKIFPAEYNEI